MQPRRLECHPLTLKQKLYFLPGLQFKSRREEIIFVLLSIGVAHAIWCVLSCMSNLN